MKYANQIIYHLRVSNEISIALAEDFNPLLIVHTEGPREATINNILEKLQAVEHWVQHSRKLRAHGFQFVQEPYTKWDDLNYVINLLTCYCCFHQVRLHCNRV